MRARGTGGAGSLDGGGGGLGCDHPTQPALPADPAYRVQLYPSAIADATLPVPEAWTLSYGFVAPPKPCSATWNHTNQTFYVWGDVDFDRYGAEGPFPISGYEYNQIVPQIMIGNCYAGNDTSYHPKGGAFADWVIQAQYFWEASDGTTYVMTGAIVPVSPGDEISTTIAYDPGTGAITASIATSSSAKRSSITIPRPFPNESPPLFASWKEFFAAALAKSAPLVTNPQLDVETHGVDEATACSVLPFQADAFGTLPGSSLKLTTAGGSPARPSSR